MTTNAGKLTPDARRAFAAAFLKSAAWLRLNMRGGAAVPADGGASRVGMRLFAHGCPRGCLREVLQLLAEDSPFRDPVVDGVVEPGLWHHKASWWARDAQTGRDAGGTVTLFREVSDGPVTRINVIEDGCGSTVTIRHEFDAVAVESPPASGQGHQVRVSAPQRDPETGLFSYYVTDTESKTKTLGELKTAEDRFYETFEQDWTGLRGTPSDPVTDGGASVSVPDPSTAPAGTTVESSFQRDLSDCSLVARARKRKAKRDVVSSKTTSKTVYEEASQTEVSAASAPLADAPEPADGLILRHTNKYRPDGLTDTSAGRQQEREVEDAEETLDETVYRSRRRVSHKSLTAAKAAALPPQSAAGGVTVSVQKSRTPGGRTDASVSTDAEKRVDDARISESRTVFGSSLSTLRRGQTSAPAASAGGGLRRSVTKEKSDGGLLTVQVEDQVESHHPGAAVSEAVTAFSRESAVVDENVPAADAAAVPPASASGGVVRKVDKVVAPGGSVKVSVSEKAETHVALAEKAVSKSPLAVRTTTSELAAAPGQVDDGTGLLVDDYSGMELAADEYGQARRAMTPGNRWNVEKTVVSDTVGAVASIARESNFLGSSVSTVSVVAAPGTEGLGLSGRAVTSLAYSRGEGGGWRETRTVDTAPAEFSEVLVDQTFNRGFGFDDSQPTGVIGREKSVLFIAARLETVRAAIQEFLGAYQGAVVVEFNTLLGPARSVFTWQRDVGFGLRPDKFGLWNGTLTLKASLEATYVYQKSAGELPG